MIWKNITVLYLVAMLFVFGCFGEEETPQVEPAPETNESTEEEPAEEGPVANDTVQNVTTNTTNITEPITIEQNITAEPQEEAYVIEPLQEIKTYEIEFDNVVSIFDVENPVAAINSKREIVLIWLGENYHDEQVIFMQLLREDGTRVGSLREIVKNTSAYIANPQVGLLDDDRFVLTYEQADKKDDESVTIFARIFTLEEELEQQIQVTDTGNIYESVLSVDNEGNFFVGWADKREDEAADLIGKMFYLSEGVISREFRLDNLSDSFVQDNSEYCGIDSSSDTTISTPYSKFNENGSLFLVWRDEKRMSETGLFVKGPYSPIGKVVVPEKRFETTQDDFVIDDLLLVCQKHRAISHSWLPSVTSNSVGEWIVIYQVINYDYPRGQKYQGWLKMSNEFYNSFNRVRQFDPEEPPRPVVGDLDVQLFLKIFSPNGEELVETGVDEEANILSNPFSRSLEWRYYAVTGKDNNILVVWTDIRNEDYSLYGHFFNNLGEPVGNSFLIASDADNPFLLADKYGDYFVFYRGLDDNDGIHFLKINTGYS